MVELQAVLPDESATMPPERLTELAVAAEELGYGTAWLPDHLLPPGEFGPTYGGVYEPLVTISFLAARTTRIRLGTSVLVLPMRSPYVVAKQAATLHRLSGERVILGLGAGWDATEFASVGATFSDRGRRTDEGLGIIRDLFEGVDRGGVFEPRPRSPLPIMIGGTTAPALRRAARYGDEWQGLNLDGAAFATAAARIRARATRPVTLGTRLHWPGGDLAPTLDLARSLVEAGAQTLAFSFGDEHGALTRMTTLAEALRSQCAE